MNEEWIDNFLEILAEDEGTEGRKVALEGGKGTRGYGITHISDGLKKFLNFSQLNADEMSDKDLARQIVLYNIDKMKADIGEETWNNLPNSMKVVASDQYYNSGKLFNGFKSDLINGNYENALKNTLDIISANDPTTNENGVMTGLVNRRIRNYNRAAQDLGLSQITDFSTGDSIVDGKKTAVTYSFNNGDPFVVNTSAAMHSASLKKTDISSEAQDAINNVIESGPEYEEIANTVLNTQGTPIEEIVSNTVDTVGNFVNAVREDTQKGEENARMIPKIVEASNKIDDEADIAQKNFETQTANDFINSIEEPQLWDLDFAQPYDQEDLDAINDVQFKRQQDLKKKYTLGDATAGAYESETIEANLYKQFSAENLAPDSSFILTQEKLDELALDLPDDFRDEFAHAHSEAHAQQIRQQLLAHLELEDKIYSHGRAKGTMLRLMAAFTDPGAWALILATDGALAPVIAIQKSVRAYRMLRKGFAGAVSIGAIEGYLASQRPDYDIDDVMHGVMTGAFLGSLFGIRTPKIKSNSFTKQFKDAADEADTKLIRDDGGFTPTGGGGKNTPPKIFNKGDRILINNKGGMGTVIGFNKTSRKLGNMNDTYVIKMDEKSKVSKTQNDKMVLSREIVDELNIKNNKNRSADLVPGPNNPNPLKPNGERTFDWYDPNYDLALHTVKRPDGRFEIKMIENQTGKPDELIMQVNRDGTVEIRKCL